MTFLEEDFLDVLKGDRAELGQRKGQAPSLTHVPVEDSRGGRGRQEELLTLGLGFVQILRK